MVTASTSLYQNSIAFGLYEKWGPKDINSTRLRQTTNFETQRAYEMLSEVGIN